MASQSLADKAMAAFTGGSTTAAHQTLADLAYNGSSFGNSTLQTLATLLTGVVDLPGLLAALEVWTGNPVTPIATPVALLNFNVVVNNQQATVTYSPPTDGSSVGFTRDGATVFTQSAALPGIWVDPVLQGAGDHTWGAYTIAGTPTAPVLGPAVTKTVTVVVPIQLGQVQNAQGTPNNQHPQLTWNELTGASSYRVTDGAGTVLSGAGISPTGTGTITFTDATLRATGASYTYNIYAVNGAGLGTVKTLSVNVPSLASLVVTAKTPFQWYDNPSTGDTHVSGTWTPAANSLILIGIAQDQNNTNLDISAISDTFAGTGGTGWTKYGSTPFDASGDEFHICWFIRVIGTAPSAGAITITKSPTGNFFWYGVSVPYEITGYSSAVPIQVTSANSTAANLTITFPSAPLAASAVFAMMINGQGDGTAPTLPAGYTSDFNSQPTSGAGTGRAEISVVHKVGGAGTALAFTAFNHAYGNLGVAIEIGQAASIDPNAVPTAPTNLVATQIQHAASGMEIDLAWDNLTTYNVTGASIYLGGTAAGNRIQTPSLAELTFTGNSVKWADSTLRAAGTYTYYVAWKNANGESALSQKIVIVSSISTTQSKIGYANEVLTASSVNSWENGQEFTNLRTYVGSSGAVWVHNWSAYTTSLSQNAVDQFVTLSTGGNRLTGCFPVFTIGFGMTGVSAQTIISGSQNAAIDAYATTIQGHISAGRLTAGKVVVRTGHEPTIATIGPWSFTSDPNSQIAWNQAMGIMCDRIHAIAPGVLVEACMYSCDFDVSAAIPWAKINIFGCDLYPDWQSVGSDKAGTGMYDPPASDTNYWNGLWYHNSSPTSPSGGSPAQFYAMGKAHGVPWSFTEIGCMARQEFPAAGGGDWAAFADRSADIAFDPTGNTHHVTWFAVAFLMVNGLLQDHDFTNGHFPNFTTRVRARYSG